MKERAVATGLFLVPFLYLAGVLLSLFSGVPIGVYFAFATCVAIALLLGLGGPTGQLVAVLLDLLLVGVVVASLLAAPRFGGLASALTAGVLIGLPFLLSSLAWRERSGLAHRTLALGLSIAAGTSLLATRAAVLAGTSPSDPTDFVQSFFTTNLDQLEGLVTLAFGGPGPDLPLQAVFDPWFTGLTALAVAGVLLLALRPRSGRDVPLPVAVSLTTTASVDTNGSLAEFSEAQRAVFRARSHDRPPTGAWPPGLDAVVLAAMVSSAFLGVAFEEPLLAPLDLVLGVVVALIALGVVGVTRPRRSRTATPPAPSPGRT